jgi:hypothetical protein
LRIDPAPVAGGTLVLVAPVKVAFEGMRVEDSDVIVACTEVALDGAVIGIDEVFVVSAVSCAFKTVTKCDCDSHKLIQR